MIDVLLATYHPNPAWLDAQIASIEAQTGVEIRLMRREDVHGEGAKGNFAALLQEATAEYVAFSDQDDIWEPDKLARELRKMQELEALYGKETPLLVFSDARVVDERLRTLDESLFRRTKIDPRRTRPRQLLLQNVATGNTILLNAALVQKARPIPSGAFMHDHWVLLVASVFGKIGFLAEPTVLYRQHDGNVIGGVQVGFPYFLRALRSGRQSLRASLYANIDQAAAFVEQFGKAAPPCFVAMCNLRAKSWPARVCTLIRHRVFKCGWIRNIGTWLIV